MLLILVGIGLLVIAALVAKLAFLWTIGIIVIVIGVILLILGYVAPTHYSGRRPWY